MASKAADAALRIFNGTRDLGYLDLLTTLLICLRTVQDTLSLVKSLTLGLLAAAGVLAGQTTVLAGQTLAGRIKDCPAIVDWARFECLRQ